ncbi:MAG TPA: hypothetical protein VKO38_02775 [Wenzhouxiangella sp.]|nr:hypothetical protein [Wenzhouxiangella sp.]
MDHHRKGWAFLSLLFMNFLPYLSRVAGGWEWVAQYWPDPGSELFGLLFFHVFYSTAAIPIIIGIFRSRTSMLPWLLPLIDVTILTVLIHHNYDLASDAQAAIGLMVFPLFTMATGFLALGIGLLLQWLPTRT